LVVAKHSPIWKNELPARHGPPGSDILSLIMPSSASTSHQQLPFPDLASASQAVQTKQASPVELTQACLNRIEHVNPQVNAFITVTADTALEEAAKAEAEIKRGEWKGPLHGMPLAVKDLVETAGVKTTAASKVLAGNVPEEDAEVMRRLRSAGAVMLGKLNLHEFAYGGSGVIGHYGPAKNPWNPAHITGGSSSGSAAAVAAGLCYGAIGTDTAGSIRLPAAYCGITGLKPSFGLVSARGVIPLSWSLDHVGPMARTAADCALMLQAIAHYDPKDINCQKFPPVYYPSAMGEPTTSLRVALAKEFFQDVDAEIVKSVETAIALIKKLVTSVSEVSLPTDVDRTVVRCESFAYHQANFAAHENDYDPETLKRIRSGADVSAADYIYRYRELLSQRRDIAKIFNHVDLIITPTAPVTPPKFSDLEKAPSSGSSAIGSGETSLRSKELIMLRNTRPFNVYGLPSISVPCGFTKSGLPIGMQISGASGAEGSVLSLAAAYQKETDWHVKTPAMA
jgi:aspartyl-tRNA(Asn)/glutamyl-tRNA(Gln) amidotransferase subunit A